jgi:hypothetical protein
VKFVSLWQGPNGLSDCVEDKDGGPGNYTVSFTWSSMGLYGLDAEGRAWTLCMRGLSERPTRWMLVDDLLSGAAARQVHAEEEEARDPPRDCSHGLRFCDPCRWWGGRAVDRHRL